MEENKYPIVGYAPGNYQCKCCDCGEVFTGDKRAVQCEPCAVASKERFDALSPAEQEELMKRNAEAVKDMFSKWNKPTSLQPTEPINHLHRDDKQYLPPLDEPILSDDDVKAWEAMKVQDKIIANQVAGMPLEEAIYQTGYASGVEFQKGRKALHGAVWVKATSIKDTPLGYVFYKFNNGKQAYKGVGQFEEFEFVPCEDYVNIRQKDYDYLEILDERAAPSDEREVEFAEWCALNYGAIYRDKVLKHWIIKDFSNDERFTTAQLHEIWEGEKRK